MPEPGTKAQLAFGKALSRFHGNDDRAAAMADAAMQRAEEVAAEFYEWRVPTEVGIRGNLTGLVRDVSSLLDRVEALEQVSRPIVPMNPCPYCRKPMADDVHQDCVAQAEKDWIGDGPDPVEFESMIQPVWNAARALTHSQMAWMVMGTGSDTRRLFEKLREEVNRLEQKILASPQVTWETVDLGEAGT